MKIKELTLQTNSIHRTRLFYHKTLELEIIHEAENKISFKAGRSVLSFEEIADKKPFYHFAFNITNNKFSDSFEWINSKLDILPVHEGMLIAGYDDWNAQSFYFYDNNGSIVEFIVRFDLPYHSANIFSSDCIEEISEIGLVVDNVAAAATHLQQVYHIPFYEKGPQLHDFIAMGDAHGLLLLCQTKRGWVPTHKQAQKFSTIVTDEHDHRISF